MKTPKIAKALEYIGDDIISEAVDCKAERMPWKKIFAIAACFFFAAAIIFALPDMGASGEDPNWDRTHFKTENADIMAAVCGEDLLLDKLAIKEGFHSEYILEIRFGGSFMEKSDFIGLSGQINYGESVIDSKGEQLYIYISFDGKANGTYIDEHLRSGEFETKEMFVNGYSIKYAKAEPLNDVNTNRIFAEFEYSGYKYYLAAESPDPDFFEDTIEYMLG